MKKKRRLGNFREVKTCTECVWYEGVNSDSRFIERETHLCPDCGSITNTVIGQYLFETTSSFFGLFSSYRSVGFKRKYSSKDLGVPPVKL